MKKFNLLVLAMFTLSATFSQTGTLVLNKGQKFQIDSKMVTTSTQEVMGQTMESNINFTTSSLIEVKDVKDRNYDLTNNISRLQYDLKMTGPMSQEMSFDSDKKDDLSSDQGNAVKGFINHPTELVMDNKGKIIAGKKEAKKDATDMTSAIMSKVIGDPSDGSYAVAMVFMAIPKDAVSGYTWVDTSSLEGNKRSTTYVIKEFKGSDAIVGINGTVEVDLKSEMQGMEIITKSKGTIKGEQTVDRNSGVLKTRKTTMESTGSVQAQGMDIPVNSKIMSEVTVK